MVNCDYQEDLGQFLSIAQKYQLEGLTKPPGEGTMTEEMEEGEIKLDRGPATRKDNTEVEKVSSKVMSSNTTDTSPTTELELKQKMSENLEIRDQSTLEIRALNSGDQRTSPLTPEIPIKTNC